MKSVTAFSMGMALLATPVSSYAKDAIQEAADATCDYTVQLLKNDYAAHLGKKRAQYEADVRTYTQQLTPIFEKLNQSLQTLDRSALSEKLQLLQFARETKRETVVEQSVNDIYKDLRILGATLIGRTVPVCPYQDDSYPWDYQPSKQECKRTVPSTLGFLGFDPTVSLVPAHGSPKDVSTIVPESQSVSIYFRRPSTNDGVMTRPGNYEDLPSFSIAQKWIEETTAREFSNYNYIGLAVKIRADRLVSGKPITIEEFMPEIVKNGYLGRYYVTDVSNYRNASPIPPTEAQYVVSHKDLPPVCLQRRDSGTLALKAEAASDSKSKAAPIAAVTSEKSTSPAGRTTASKVGE